MNTEEKYIGRIHKALEIAKRGIQTDGSHHKQWFLDQIVRALAGCPMVTTTVNNGIQPVYEYTNQGMSDEYRQFVADAMNGEDGPETYEWDAGTPP